MENKTQGVNDEKSVKTNIMSTKFFMPDEIDALSESQIENFLRQRRTPSAIEASPYEYYPTRQDQMTQPGFSGYGVSIPTIAPTSALLPMGIIQKRIADLQQREAMQPAPFKMPELKDLSDLNKNVLLQENFHGFVNKYYDWAADMSEKNTGSRSFAGTILNNSPEFQNNIRKYNNLVEGHNQVFETITKVRQDVDEGKYYHPEFIKAIDEYPKMLDEFVNGGVDNFEKNMSKLSGIVNDIQGYLGTKHCNKMLL